MKLFHRTLQDAATQYADILRVFAESHGITTLVVKPVDHVAVKAKDATHFQVWINEIEHDAEKLSFTILNNRRIATAILSEPITLGTFGETNFLEIMEPKPEKVGNDFVGLEHSELYEPDLSRAEKVLQEQNVVYKRQKSNKYHETLVVVITKDGQEVKFTNKPLVRILRQEEHNQHVTYIK